MKEWQNLRYHIHELESRICFGEDGLLRDCKIVNPGYKPPSHEEVEKSDPYPPMKDQKPTQKTLRVDMNCATLDYKPSHNAQVNDYVQGHQVEMYGCFTTESE